MDLGLAARVAIVGGASRGIGRAIALALAQEGCSVVICARGQEELEAAAAEIRAQTGAQVLPVVCDMADHDDIRRLVRQTAEVFGRIDIVVNNAGGPPLGTFDDFGDAEWQKAIDQNFLSAVRTTRDALPFLRKRGGRIINITSVAVKQPIDRLMLSNSARLAVIGMAKTLSREVARDGITVNNVCPGNIATQRLLSLFEARAQREGRTFQEVVAEEEGRTPTGFLGEPADVAALVTFLASDKARYISGATIQVDGGSTVAVF
jgi:3-oxoacyl-[acyl-carrier protein] reductase